MFFLSNYNAFLLFPHFETGDWALDIISFCDGVVSLILFIDLYLYLYRVNKNIKTLSCFTLGYTKLLANWLSLLRKWLLLSLFFPFSANLHFGPNTSWSCSQARVFFKTKVAEKHTFYEMVRGKCVLDCYKNIRSIDF